MGEELANRMKTMFLSVYFQGYRRRRGVLLIRFCLICLNKIFDSFVIEALN